MRFKGRKFMMIIACWSMSQIAYADYEELVVFGDSLSDNGNLAALSSEFGVVLNNPPFYQGRVSDGPVAVDVLARLMGVELTAFLKDGGTNYAVAGAHASRTGDASDDLIRLKSQVTQYLGFRAPTPKTLYVIAIGGNDVRAATSLSPTGADRALKRAASAIEAQVKRLISAGARYFLVLEAPDISSIPETLETAKALRKPALIRLVRQRTNLFNRQLALKLNRLNKPNKVRIAIFGSAELTRTMTSRPDNYGFKIVRRGCFKLKDGRPEYKSGCGPEGEIVKFAYFDSIHPTRKIHERVGRLFYAFMPEMR